MPDDSRLLVLGALGAGLAGLALYDRSKTSSHGKTCRLCGSRSIAPHLSRVELHRISEALRMRRFDEPAVWLLPAAEAQKVKEKWEAFSGPRRKALALHPEQITAKSMIYGRRKAKKEHDQVIPYAAARQTKEEFAAWIAPPKEQRFTPFSMTDKNGEHRIGLDEVLGKMKLALLLPDSSRSEDLDQPRIQVRDKKGRPYVIFATDLSEGLFWPFGLWDVNLFTATTKMSAPSFSLPAGAPEMGGSCSAAALTVEGGREKDNICGQCYALKGNYGYLSNVITSLVRMAFVNQELEADPTGKKLGEELARAITSFAKFSALDGWGGDGEEGGRRRQELGVWQNGQICGPRRIRGAFELQPLDGTRLHDETAVARGTTVSTHDLFRARKPKAGDVCGYFRVHDSGDFTVTKTTAYIRAWGFVADALPHVQFWAPTRLWIITPNAKELAKLVTRGHFAVRPSALNVGDVAPVVVTASGPLSEGTTVNRYVAATHAYVPAFDEDGKPAYQCPVYSRIVDGKEAKSCRAAGCRVCWEAQDVPVTYGKH